MASNSELSSFMVWSWSITNLQSISKDTNFKLRSLTHCKAFKRPKTSPSWTNSNGDVYPDLAKTKAPWWSLRQMRWDVRSFEVKRAASTLHFNLSNGGAVQEEVETEAWIEGCISLMFSTNLHLGVFIGSGLYDEAENPNRINFIWFKIFFWCSDSNRIKSDYNWFGFQIQRF